MSDIERGNQSHSDNANLKSGTQKSLDENRNRLELYKAALSNDWEKAETIYKNAGMRHGVEITSRGETALHVAALAGHIEFVQNLVQKMNLEEMRVQTKLAKSHETGKGNTTFHCAVISGNVKIAKAIMKCEDLRDLAMAKGVGNNLPIYMAAEKGNDEMVRYLYDLSYKNHLENLNCRDRDDEDRKIFFLSLIKSNIYDVALQMAKALLSRQIAPDGMEEEALEELAQIPLNPPGFLDRCIHSFSTRQAVVMQANAVELVGLLWDSLTLSEKRVTAFINSPDPNPIIEAAKRGNFNFLSILVATYPDVLFMHDNNKYTIVHHAILNRHVDIFKFIHIGSTKTIVTMHRDLEGNNMLHLAAKLAPSSRLSIVPGAALQLQRELLWFEEVKKVMEPHEVNRKKYYLSDFPLNIMLLLVEEMKKVMDEVTFEEGLFEKMKKAMDQLSSELKEYHPSYQGQSKIEFSQYILFKDHIGKKDMKSPMNQSDVVLLFKKLKKAMEQEYDELEHYTQLWEILDSFQEINKELDEYEVNQTNPVLVLNKVKAIIGRHEDLGYFMKQHQLLGLFQEFNELMGRYESNQSCDTEQLFEELSKALSNYPTTARPSNTQMQRVACFFTDLARLMGVHESNTGAFFKESKNLMEKYNDLKEYPPRMTQVFTEMRNLYEDIDEWMQQHRQDSAIILEYIKGCIQWSKLPKHMKYKRVMDLFQEMKNVIEQHELNQSDKFTEEYTPHDVFVKEHENLMEKGEKWMRDTANSCMIVAVLITTIAFAAAITVPGGNGDDGYPNFSKESLFIAFAIADSTSMISSAISLLNFLSILTARYTVDDFRWSLPNKLFIGLLTIFISIVAMMVAFVLSIFIIFDSSPPALSILIAAASSVPVALFLWQHLSLFVDVFRSTYASYFLFKPRSDPSSVFKLTSSSDAELKKTR